jgi:hypothetical protein
MAPYLGQKLRRARSVLSRAIRALGRTVTAMGSLAPVSEFVDLLPPETAWQASLASLASLSPATLIIEPPNISAVLGTLVHPEQRGAIVRFNAAMHGTDFMAAYPWSPEHGWSACN